jgi:hypothetical protein
MNSKLRHLEQAAPYGSSLNLCCIVIRNRHRGDLLIILSRDYPQAVKTVAPVNHAHRLISHVEFAIGNLNYYLFERDTDLKKDR